jgi:hypothetical protein
VEGRELDAVPIDFADVEVGPDLVDMLGWDVVCGTPDVFRRFMLGEISVSASATGRRKSGRQAMETR